MKRTILLAFALCLAISGCQKEDPEIPEADMAEYTVMVYGCGGGNLDNDLVSNILSSLRVGSTDKVKMTWEFNMSKAYQKSSLSGTVRIIVPNEKIEGTYTNVNEAIELIAKTDGVSTFSDTPIALYDPENLAGFIDWSASECPANNYILVIWDHGECWRVKNEGTKAAIFDDNFEGNPAMSLNELVEGVEQSSVKHLAAIYNDNCLSAEMEYYTAYAEFADFAVGSANPASGNGGRYDKLLELLNWVSGAPSEAGLASALKTYCDLVAYTWSSDNLSDISFFDLRNIKEMNELIRQMADAIVLNYPQKKDKYDSAVRMSTVYLSIKDYIYPDIDIYSLLNWIHDNTSEDPYSQDSSSDISKWYVPFKALLEKTLYVSPNGKLQDNANKVTIGVNYLTGDEYKDAASLYEQTAFHKATGWGKVLSTFQQPLSEENVILNKIK